MNNEQLHTTNTMTTSSEYINEQRRAYSLYTLQSRAIPSIIDGLKAAGRRVLWTARDGHKIKTATLAGATMPLHPHSEASSSINTLAAPYGNNVPLFKGYGAFGTLLDPSEYGASRYTSVAASPFSMDVLFRDIELVPMVDNYDGTLQEPVHFLPLVPIVLLNPTEGIAVGFATNILPRALDDVIKSQIDYLTGKKSAKLVPKFTPTNNTSTEQVTTDRGVAYYFCGEVTVDSATTATITNLPYGMPHGKILSNLDDLQEAGTVIHYEDSSRDTISISIKFKRGTLSTWSHDELISKLGLRIRQIENFNVLDFNGTSIRHTTAQEVIPLFTDWRLAWYKRRYERLLKIAEHDLQRLYDVRTAIAKNVGKTARLTESRAELKKYLATINIVFVDYIADLPVYRFTDEEKIKNDAKIAEAERDIDGYKELIADESKRKQIYVQELTEVLNKYNKQQY